MAALMPTSVSSAVRKLGAQIERPLEQHQHHELADQPSSDSADHGRHPPRRRRLQARRRAPCCARGQRPRRGTSEPPPRPARRRTRHGQPRKAEGRRGPSFVASAATKTRMASASDLGAALGPGAARSRRPAAACARAQARRADQVAAAEADGGVGQQALDGRRQHLRGRAAARSAPPASAPPSAAGTRPG